MKPILFNTEMVRAILDGRKTQTRRVVKDNNKFEQITLDRLCCICGFFDEETMNYGCTHKECEETGEDINGKEHGRCFSWSCPFGQQWGYEDDCESSFDGDTYINIPISPYKVGDIFYVIEEMIIDCDLDPWYVANDEYVDAFIDDGTKPYPKLDEEKYGEEYTGIVLAEDMPKECARIFLKVTNVRVERLQDISENDAKKRGS